MIPGPWTAITLALATFRIVRLIGWDDLPPIVRARNWATGAGPPRHSLTTSDGPIIDYRRPTLQHFLTCAYCQGFWVSLTVYILWLLFPTETLYTLAAFALSAAVGITARMLDP